MCLKIKQKGFTLDLKRTKALQLLEILITI